MKSKWQQNSNRPIPASEIEIHKNFFLQNDDYNHWADSNDVANTTQQRPTKQSKWGQ